MNKNKIKKINIEISCETKEAYRELEETLDEFRSHLDNIEGNCEGFSFKVISYEIHKEET